jgi:hypothetical protein
MRRIFKYTSLCLFVSSLHSFANDDPNWFDQRKALIESFREGKSEDSIKGLGRTVSGLGRHLDSISPEEKEIFDEAKQALISYPPAVDFFGEEIKKLMDEQVGNGFTKSHPDQRYWYFETLDQLPSPETIKVLGELLFDERNPWIGRSGGDSNLPAANATYSVEALNKIGLKSPPSVTSDLNDEKDIKTWQLWFEQVRAGKRNFSFTGDDRAYTLEGPVTEPVIARSARTLPPQTPVSAAQVRPTNSSIWPLAIALLVGLGSVFVVVKKSKR